MTSQLKSKTLMKKMKQFFPFVVATIIIEVLLVWFSRDLISLPVDAYFFTVFTFMLVFLAFFLVAFQLIMFPRKSSGGKGIIIEGDNLKIGLQFITNIVKLFEFDRITSRLSEMKLETRIFYRGTRLCKIVLDIETGVFEFEVRTKVKTKGDKLINDLMNNMIKTAGEMHGKTKVISRPPYRFEPNKES